MDYKEIQSEDKDLMVQIGIKLQELRKSKEISVSVLARQVGMSRNGYHRMEVGEVYFNIATLLQILKYHHISLMDFFTSIKQSG